MNDDDNDDDNDDGDNDDEDAAAAVGKFECFISTTGTAAPDAGLDARAGTSAAGRLRAGSRTEDGTCPVSAAGKPAATLRSGWTLAAAAAAAAATDSAGRGGGEAEETGTTGRTNGDEFTDDSSSLASAAPGIFATRISLGDATWATWATWATGVRCNEQQATKA